MGSSQRGSLTTVLKIPFLKGLLSTSAFQTTAIVIMLAGAVLRIAGLTASPFWYDESFTVYLVRYSDQMIPLLYQDFNPPLWEMVVWPFIRLLGETEFALRLPALLSSLAALWLTWEVAKDLLKPRWSESRLLMLAVTAMAALLPYHFWMAQDGRCYALMSVLYMAAIYFAVKGRWIGFGASIGLLVYTSSASLFYAAAAGLGALVLRWPERKRILISGSLGAAAIIPWLPSFFQRASAHWVGDLNLIGLNSALYYSFFANVLPETLNTLASLVIVTSLIAALAASLVHFKNKNQLALGIWAIMPLLLMLALSPIKNVIFYRPLSAMLLPCCIWVPASLWPTKWVGWRWRFGIILPQLWAGIIIAGLIFWSPSLKGGELRSVAAMIEQQRRPGDVIYHATGLTYLPFSLYLSDPGYVLNEEQHPAMLSSIHQKAFGIQRAALEDIPHRRAWVIYGRDWLMDDHALQRMDQYIQDGKLVGTVHYWQISETSIYLVE